MDICVRDFEFGGDGCGVHFDIMCKNAEALYYIGCIVYIYER